MALGQRQHDRARLAKGRDLAAVLKFDRLEEFSRPGHAAAYQIRGGRRFTRSAAFVSPRLAASSCRPGNFYNVKPQTPLSFQGPTQASTIAQKIAGYLGMSLENNGVNTVLTNPYYASDAVSMIRDLAEHAGFDWIMDKGVLAITPPGQARAGDPVLISPSTGMVGYPTFVSPNIVVKSLWIPQVKYQGLIQVQSELTPACGMWKVIKLDLDLEAKYPAENGS
jgi:hypothetical protein